MAGAFCFFAPALCPGMQFLHCGSSGSALVVCGSEEYRSVNIEIRETIMTYLRNLAYAMSSAWRTGPVPCWFDYLHQTSERRDG